LAAAARKAINRELEAEANVLKLEAERKLGQLLQAHKQTVGFNKGGGDQRSYHRDSKKLISAVRAPCGVETEGR
jgi:hypothetical protein